MNKAEVLALVVTVVARLYLTRIELQETMRWRTGYYRDKPAAAFFDMLETRFDAFYVSVECLKPGCFTAEGSFCISSVQPFVVVAGKAGWNCVAQRERNLRSRRAAVLLGADVRQVS